MEANKHEIIKCTSCGKEFKFYNIVGKCPHCSNWITFECKNCSKTISAEDYIKNDNRCPGCNSPVSLPGTDTVIYKKPGEQMGKLAVWVVMFIIGLVIVALVRRC